MENSDTFISLGASCRELGSVHITQEMGRNNGLTDIRQSALQRCYVEQDSNSSHMQTCSAVTHQDRRESCPEIVAAICKFLGNCKLISSFTVA